MLIANLEADELINQVVTSIRKQDYIVKYASGATLKNNRRHDKRGLIKQLARIGKQEDIDYTLELEYTYGPIGLATYLVDRQLNKLKHVTGCDIMNLWLGPDDGSNFRYKSAKTQPYKGTRPPKPDILIQLRNYLINIKGAQVIYGYEADDALGIYQDLDIPPWEINDRVHLTNTVAVHCDKDIFMIPGTHYNTMTDKFVEVSELGELTLDKGKVKGTGLAFFYFQMLMGDRTDNIPNLAKGWGDTKCYKVLEHCECEQDYLVQVASQYQQELGVTWINRFLEQADLVWICRNKEEKGSDYIKRQYKELCGVVI